MFHIQRNAVAHMSLCDACDDAVDSYDVGSASGEKYEDKYEEAKCAHSGEQLQGLVHMSVGGNVGSL